MSDTKQHYTIPGRLVSIILPVCLIAGGVAGFKYYASQERKMKKRPPRAQVVMVETMPVQAEDYHSSVGVMGTVVPDKQVTLKARVTGEVMFVSKQFEQGGVVKQGELLLLIDDSDYQIEVKKAQSALDKALSDLEIEKGSQEIAKEGENLAEDAKNIGDTKADAGPDKTGKDSKKQKKGDKNGKKDPSDAGKNAGTEKK